MDEPKPPDCGYDHPAHKQAWIHWAQVQMPSWARMQAKENQIDACRYRWMRDADICDPAVDPALLPTKQGADLDAGIDAQLNTPK